MSVGTFQLADLVPFEPCQWSKRLAWLGNPKLTECYSLGDVARFFGVEDALWVAAHILDRRGLVALLLPSVVRVNTASDGSVPEDVAALQRWLSGDDTVDLVAAAEALGGATPSAAQLLIRVARSGASLEARLDAAWIAARAAKFLDPAGQIADIVAAHPPLHSKAEAAA